MLKLKPEKTYTIRQLTDISPHILLYPYILLQLELVWNGNWSLSLSKLRAILALAAIQNLTLLNCLGIFKYTTTRTACY